MSLTGDAPQPGQTCITDAIKGITLASDNGKPGRTGCTTSGQLMGDTTMIMSDSSYELREGEAPAGEGEAKAPSEADLAPRDDAGGVG